jgi:hypothetical protein
MRSRMKLGFSPEKGITDRASSILLMDAQYNEMHLMN